MYKVTIPAGCDFLRKQNWLRLLMDLLKRYRQCWNTKI